MCIRDREYIRLFNRYDAEGLSQEELASVLFLDKAVVTRSLTLLEQKGLVRREQDTHDRRVKRIFLTEYAKTQKEFFQGIIKSWVKYLASGMDPDEVGTMIQGFHDAANRACNADIPALVEKTKGGMKVDAEKDE